MKEPDRAGVLEAVAFSAGEAAAVAAQYILNSPNIDSHASRELIVRGAVTTALLTILPPALKTEIARACFMKALGGIACHAAAAFGAFAWPAAQTRMLPGHGGRGEEPPPDYGV